MSTEQRSEPRLSREQQFAFDCWTKAGGVLRDRILRASGLPSAYWVELQATIASIIAHRRLATGGYLQRGMVRASGPDTTAVYGPTRKDDSGGWGAALADAAQLVQSLEVQRDEARGKHESFRERIRYTLELPLSVTDDDLVFAVGGAREAQKEAEDDGGEEDADRTSDTPSPAPAERELGEDEWRCPADGLLVRFSVPTPDGYSYQWEGWDTPLCVSLDASDDAMHLAALAWHRRTYPLAPTECRLPSGLVGDLGEWQVRDAVTHEALEVRHDTELNGRRVLLIDMDSHSLVWAPGTAATHGTPASDPSQAARLREMWDKCTKVEERCRSCKGTGKIRGTVDGEPLTVNCYSCTPLVRADDGTEWRLGWRPGAAYALQPDECYPPNELPRKMADDEVRDGTGAAHTIRMERRSDGSPYRLVFGSWSWQPGDQYASRENNPENVDGQLARLQAFWDANQKPAAGPPMVLAESEFVWRGDRLSMRFVSDPELGPGLAIDGHGVYAPEEVRAHAKRDPNPLGWPRALAYFDKHTRPNAFTGKPRPQKDHWTNKVGKTITFSDPTPEGLSFRWSHWPESEPVAVRQWGEVMKAAWAPTAHAWWRQFFCQSTDEDSEPERVTDVRFEAGGVRYMLASRELPVSYFGTWYAAHKKDRLRSSDIALIERCWAEGQKSTGGPASAQTDAGARADSGAARAVPAEAHSVTPSGEVKVPSDDEKWCWKCGQWWEDICTDPRHVAALSGHIRPAPDLTELREAVEQWNAGDIGCRQVAQVAERLVGK